MRVADDAGATYRQACQYLVGLQRDNGSWEGEMVWNTSCLAQYVIVRRIVDRRLDERTRQGAIRHFRYTRTREGGWGLYREAGASLYCTTLAYVALRLLGLPPEDPLPAEARRWLRIQRGGVDALPDLGKFWLALLGLVPYGAVTPVTPEVVLLPTAFPAHPDRMLSWTRMLYQSMAYLYGARFCADPGGLREALREELFGDRAPVSPGVPSSVSADVRVPPGRILRGVQAVLRAYERVHSARLRTRALDDLYRCVVEEQRASPHHGLSLVNALLECLVLYARRPDSVELNQALQRLEYWRWEDDGPEGVRFCGDRSTNWDTSFAVEALLSYRSGQAAGGPGDSLRKAHAYLRGAQVSADLRHGVPFHTTVDGGWAFSDGNSTWPVSDCTAEAVEALLRLERSGAIPVGDRITAQQLRSAVEFVLDRQNRDGGFGTIDRRRAGSWLEALNPSEMYANCMTDSSALECTGSALAALAQARPSCEGDLQQRIDKSARRAVAYLRAGLHADGSLPGTWGINYTYAAFFTVRGLRAAGVPRSDESLRRAAHWLIRTQRADGGWGEHHSSCVEHRYVEHSRSLPEMTSWALLAAMEVLGPGHAAILRGIRWLQEHQLADGSWPAEQLNGVFFETMMLSYRLYPAYFPAWALGRHLQLTDGQHRQR